MPIKHTYLMLKHGPLSYVCITLWPSTIGDDSTISPLVSRSQGISQFSMQYTYPKELITSFKAFFGLFSLELVTSSHAMLKILDGSLILSSFELFYT